MTNMFNHARACLAATLLVAAFCPSPALSETVKDDQRVVVLTSYPEELTARFQKAFEQANPGMRVEILWRHSADALAYLRAGGIGEIDVYWTPAPRNFALLKGEGKFARLTLDTQALPQKVAGYAISDADGYYAAFELAGYGIAWHPEEVKKLGLPAPKDWSDLGNPAYRGKVQIPVPGQVGFAPVMIEAVLQGKEWEKSWADLAAIAANADFDRGDRTNETDDVSAGRKAARMTIDFFTPPARRNAQPIKGEEFAFVYPPKTAFNPSHVAISAQAPHPEAARALVSFLLSKPAQEMLLEPDVRRLPVRRDVYAAHTELTANPFADGNLAYDDALRRDRQGLVAAIFDVAFVQAHKQIVPLWEALTRAEKQKQGDAARRGEVRALLTAVPVSAAEQSDQKLRRLFDFPDLVPGKTPPPASPERLAVEARWKKEVDARLEKARQLLQAL